MSFFSIEFYYIFLYFSGALKYNEVLEIFFFLRKVKIIIILFINIVFLYIFDYMINNVDILMYRGVFL